MSYKKILKNGSHYPGRPFVRQSVAELSVHGNEEGYNKENVYEDILTSKPSKVEYTPGETMPLMSRVVPDGSTGIPQSAIAETTEDTKASLEAKVTVYSQLDHHPNPGVSAPPLENELQYASVNKFQNPQGLLYECIKVKSQFSVSQQEIPDDIHKTASEYSKILHVLPPHNTSPEETAKLTTSSDEPNSDANLHDFLPEQSEKAKSQDAVAQEIQSLSKTEEKAQNDETQGMSLLVKRSQLKEIHTGGTHNMTADREEMQAIGSQVGDTSVDDAVEKQNNPMEDGEVLTEELVTGKGQAKIFASETNQDSHPPSKVDDISSSSDGMGPEGISEESKSTSVDISASEDEGYSGGHKGNNCKSMHLSQQHSCSTEAVQPESTDNPQDRVIVHTSSKMPTIMPKDHTKFSEVKHVINEDIQEHCSEAEGTKGPGIVPGIYHGVSEDEQQTMAGRKVVTEFSPGLSELSAYVKSFTNTCDIAYTEDLLPYRQSDQLDYFSLILPTLTLPDDLIAASRKSDDVMEISQEEPNEDVTVHKYDRDANEGGLLELPSCCQSQTETAFSAELQTGIGSNTYEAIEEVDLHGLVCKGIGAMMATTTMFVPVMICRRVSEEVYNSLIRLNWSMCKATTSYLVYPHMQDPPKVQTAKRILLASYGHLDQLVNSVSIADQSRRHNGSLAYMDMNFTKD